jgi:hypothetical protein
VCACCRSLAKSRGRCTSEVPPLPLDLLRCRCSSHRRSHRRTPLEVHQTAGLQSVKALGPSCTSGIGSRRAPGARKPTYPMTHESGTNTTRRAHRRRAHGPRSKETHTPLPDLPIQSELALRSPLEMPMELRYLMGGRQMLRSALRSRSLICVDQARVGLPAPLPCFASQPACPHRQWHD